MNTVHRLVPRDASGRVRPAGRRRKANSRPSASAPPLHISRGHLHASGLIDPKGDRSLLAEEMRIVKRPLLAQAMIAEGGDRDRVILVTSARPGEGKTFTSVNLALSIAQERDARVVLIDADATMRGAQQALGIEDDGPGLTEFLFGKKISLARILRRTDIPRLTFVSAGGAGNGKPELYSSRRMAAVVETLLRADERLIIVIDAPPVLATSEALALAEHAGQTLFVIEAGATARDAVEQAIELIADHTDVQLMLNKTTAGRAQGNYSYYYYDEYNKPATVQKAPPAPWWRRLFAGTPLGLGVGMWFAMAAAPVALAGWAVVPRIELAAAFTDNVETERDGERDADLVAKVAPGVRVEGDFSRLKVLTDYAMEVLGFATHRKESDIRHKLEAGLRGEVVDNLIYLDLQGEIGDTLLADSGPTSIGEFNITDNRVTEMAGSISPYLKRRLGDWADLEARYRVTHVGANDDSLADVTSQTVTARLEGLDRQSPLGWVASAVWDKADFDATESQEGRQSETIIAALDTSYEINDRLALLGGIGYSSLDDDTRDNGGETGPYWQVGFEARPTRSTRLRATGGQLFDEPNINVEAEWRPGAFTALRASYIDRLSSRFDRFRRELEEHDPFEEMPEEEDELALRFDEILPEDAITRRNEGLYRQRFAELSLTTRIGRNFFFVGGNAEDRDFDQSSNQQSYGARLGWIRELNRSTELRAGTAWRHIDLSSGSEQEEVSATAALIHRINPSTVFSLGYQFDKSMVEEDKDKTSNTFFVRLKKEF